MLIVGQRRPVRHRRRLPPAGTRLGQVSTRSLRPVPRAAGHGTCSGTPVSGRTLTCSRSATRSAPGRASNAIAGGDQILRYLRDAAAAHGVDKGISYHSGVDWSPVFGPGADARWTVTVEDTRSGTGASEPAASSICAPAITATTMAIRRNGPAWSDFTGQVVHPQDWPTGLDLDGKRVVVIGSGATAVTLVPAIAEQGASVTMVQRSPSYVMALPARDPIAGLLRKVLSERARLRGRSGGRTPGSRRPFTSSAAGTPTARGRCSPAARASGCPRATTWPPISPRRMTRGTSGCASRRTGTSSPRFSSARRRSSPMTSRLSPPAAFCCGPEPRSRRT